ncbi:uncharacterized protein [Littorina saxatilis]|uniref:uncharacterized protein n=1 Tax=Littorina saxatilis TaxID=31220 RepID=UPI0038B6987E
MELPKKRYFLAPLANSRGKETGDRFQPLVGSMSLSPAHTFLCSLCRQSMSGHLSRAAVLTLFLIYYCTSCPAADGRSTVGGLHFLRDSSYDHLKVTDDPDGLDLIATTVTMCTHLCSLRAWCTSFFYTKSSGLCTLHATVFIDPPDASDSVGTRYYRNVVGWCRPQLIALLYSRQAEMCMYFETDPGKRADWSSAVDACANMGMRLASNLTPLRMDALMNITKRPTMTTPLFIGLYREQGAGNYDLLWLDGQAADMTALGPYWEPKQPNGQGSQQCILHLTSPGTNWLNDVPCGDPHEFVCELVRPY